MGAIRTQLITALLLGVVILALAVTLSALVMAQSSTNLGLTASITCDCSKSYEVGETVPITIKVYRNGIPAPHTEFSLEADSSISGFGSYGAFNRALTLQTDGQGVYIFKIAMSDVPDQTVTVHVDVPSGPPYGPNEPVSSNVVNVKFVHHSPYLNWGGLFSEIGIPLIFSLVFVIAFLPVALPIIGILVVLLYLVIKLRKRSNAVKSRPR